MPIVLVIFTLFLISLAIPWVVKDCDPYGWFATTLVLGVVGVVIALFELVNI